MTQSAPTATQTGTPLDLSDITPFADFGRECERKNVATRAQLQWWLRYRRENGLLASGAIVEKRMSPTAKRPMLFVVRPRFVEWLTNSHLNAA